MGELTFYTFLKLILKFRIRTHLSFCLGYTICVLFYYINRRVVRKRLPMKLLIN